jgi:hypothetical protein
MMLRSIDLLLQSFYGNVSEAHVFGKIHMFLNSGQCYHFVPRFDMAFCNVLSSTCRSRSGLCDGWLGLCCSTIVDFSLFTAFCKCDIVDSVVFRRCGRCPRVASSALAAISSFCFDRQVFC